MKIARGKDCLLLVVSLFAALFAAVSCQEQINYPAPTVTGLSPTNVNAGQPAFTLTVIGAHFTPASTVLWNGSARVSFFQDEGHINADILQSDVENAGQAQVTVETPQPGGGTFQPPVVFVINPVTVPTPTITSLSPADVIVNSGALTLYVNGTNFVGTSIVTVNGANHTTHEITSTQLEVALTAADVADAGSLQIAVFNPPVVNAPSNQPTGGGSSNVVSLPINNPSPVISAVNPLGAAINSAATSIVVSGLGLVPDSVVLINGSPRVTVLSSGTLDATLTAGDLANAGESRIQVTNPVPGGGTSNAVIFTVSPSVSAGLPVLLDYAFDGTVANNGICGTNCANGTPNLTTAGPSLDAGGTTVAFASISSNLIQNQANSASQIFTRNTCLGNVSCESTNSDASVGPAAVVANGPSTEPSLAKTSSDLAFTSTATNLTDSTVVSSGYRQIYWEPSCAGASVCIGAVLVTLGADGNSGNGDSYNPAISPDGQYVTFVSLATNLVSGVTVDGATPQVYVRTICSGATPSAPVAGCTPTTYLVSANYTANLVTPGNAASSHPTISSNGTFVAYESSATNLGSAAPNPNAQQEIFLQSVCEISASGCTQPFNTLVSTPDGVTPGDAPSSEPVITSEGRFVAFASSADNLGPATGGVQQVFVRDTCGTNQTGLIVTGTCSPTTALVSTVDGTTPANGLSESPSIGENCSLTSSTSCTSGPIVAFATYASNLGPNVVTGVENIFVRNTCLSITAGSACSINTNLASQPYGILPEPSNGSSIMPSISGDGHSVAFLSIATNLVATANTLGLEHAYLGPTGF